MLLAALSTGHKVGLALVGAAFIVFALVSAFLVPAFRPDYPGRKGLPAFLTLTVALFLGMLFAVFFFGREPSESRAEGASTSAETTAASTATSAATTTAATSTAATSTSASTTTSSTTSTAPKSVAVSETEFKIALPKQSLSAGSYEFDLTNKGHISHDLVVNGPGVSDEKTPVIAAGKTATLKVDLKAGTYDLYCSVPGHKQAGMDVKINVA